MNVEVDNVKIVLTKAEIVDFWNIILFALDLDVERKKKDGWGCMSNSEFELANKIVNILKELK